MKNKGKTFAYRYGDGIYINLTNRCCNNCTFCLRNDGDGVGGNVLWLVCEPTAAEAIEQAEKIALTFTPRQVVFCGYGEPTYRLDEMISVAKWAHEKGFETRLNTNGLGNLINGCDVAKKLKGSIDVVSVSLNEPTAEEYDLKCRSVFGKDAYPALKEFTRNCAAEGIETVMSVVDIIGEQAIDRCREIAAECGAKLRVRRYETTW